MIVLGVAFCDRFCVLLQNYILSKLLYKVYMIVINN